MFLHKEKAIYPVLLVSVLIIAACGILYQLLLSSVSSYFLGNSILQFSLTIGFFMFFMGAGSYISRFIQKNLFDTFIFIEIILGFVGGISATILYLIYAYTPHYYLYNFVIISILGVLIGLEIPIVARIINKYSSLKETVADIFSFDYVGALAASILFPLVLLPWLGIIKTALFIGLINILVAFYNALLFRKLLKYSKLQISVSTTIFAVFIVGFIFSHKIDNKLEQKIYQDKIIFSTQTKYQKLVLTRWNNDYRLFINGAIQFSSVDEYRYHESLVHFPLLLIHNHEKILVLGGGDGMVVRELLKYPDIKQIHLVDLDPEMTRLAKENKIFRKLNKNSFEDKRVTIFNQDAYNFVKNSSEIYSAVIIDLPDPNDTGLGKLYSREFYEMLKGRMAAGGIMVTQSTSPYFAPKAFWCIKHTLDSVFNNSIAYQTNVPSFGIWGFVMAGGALNNFLNDKKMPKVKKIQTKITKNLKKYKISSQLRYFNANQVPVLLYFEPDMKEIPTEINTLNTQKLVEYYYKSANNWR